MVLDRFLDTGPCSEGFIQCMVLMLQGPYFGQISVISLPHSFRPSYHTSPYHPLLTIS